jgi:F-type H+-transporting ATPase subunit alpha
MIDDFGPDFDEEGQPLEEGESDRIKVAEEREQPARTEAEAAAEREAAEEAEKAEEVVEEVTA